MIFFGDGTINTFRVIHKSAMMDECELLSYLPGGRDRYNMPEPDEHYHTATLACFFKPVRSDEVNPETNVPTLDGFISFDQISLEQAEVSISSHDWLRLTKLHGDELSQLYEIAGELQRDSLAVIVPVKKVTLQEEVS